MEEKKKFKGLVVFLVVTVYICTLLVGLMIENTVHAEDGKVTIYEDSFTGNKANSLAVFRFSNHHAFINDKLYMNHNGSDWETCRM